MQKSVSATGYRIDRIPTGFGHLLGVKHVNQRLRCATTRRAGHQVCCMIEKFDGKGGLAGELTPVILGSVATDQKQIVIGRRWCGAAIRSIAVRGLITCRKRHKQSKCSQ